MISCTQPMHQSHNARGAWSARRSNGARFDRAKEQLSSERWTAVRATNSGQSNGARESASFRNLAWITPGSTRPTTWSVVSWTSVWSEVVSGTWPNKRASRSCRHQLPRTITRPRRRAGIHPCVPCRSTRCVQSGMEPSPEEAGRAHSRNVSCRPIIPGLALLTPAVGFGRWTLAARAGFGRPDGPRHASAGGDLGQSLRSLLSIRIRPRRAARRMILSAPAFVSDHPTLKVESTHVLVVRVVHCRIRVEHTT